MAVARYQTKRNAMMTALIAPTTVLPAARPAQNLVALMSLAVAAAATLRVIAKAAADQNLVRIAKEIVSIHFKLMSGVTK